MKLKGTYTDHMILLCIECIKSQIESSYDIKRHAEVLKGMLFLLKTFFHTQCKCHMCIIKSKVMIEVQEKKIQYPSPVREKKENMGSLVTMYSDNNQYLEGQRKLTELLVISQVPFKPVSTTVSCTNWTKWNKNSLLSHKNDCISSKRLRGSTVPFKTN